jgi:hypothetical protein
MNLVKARPLAVNLRARYLPGYYCTGVCSRNKVGNS